MKALNGKQFARLVETHGRRLLRTNGSHHIYGEEGERTRLSIPIHGASPLKSGLLRHLAKTAGLADDDLG